MGQGRGSGLAADGIVVTYPAEARGGTPTTAVRGVSLTIAPGEVVALLGPSGCGKSSLLRAIAGLEPLSDGDVRWEGESVASMPVHKRGFGLMFQDGQLFVHRDVAGNVAYGIHELPGAEQEARVAELLELVGLSGFDHRRVTSLSGGERQRVALARSLAPRPRLLLLDEPLSALDRNLRERLAEDVAQILRAAGTTALYVTHDHVEARAVADRVGVMLAGELARIGTPSEVWGSPGSEAVSEFLGVN